MKFTLSWLKAPLDTDADVDTIAEKLTSIGLEVESVEDAGARLKDFTVAEIITAEKHPNADKLRLCMVNAGDGAPLQIVCGAPNARAGIKVVLAKPGTVIPVTGEALKIGTIRGVESRGMMCSARELLLGDDHEGIIELPADAKVGDKAAVALGLTDPVIDISLTPNRGDCTAVYGIARDLAASGLGRLRQGDLSPVPGKFASPIKTHVETEHAPVFAGRLIRGVKNGPSPMWLRDWLKAVGLRPISALVDVTNFISLDRGRPLHVYDAAKVRGDLRARLAKDGETLRALDGKTYTLDPTVVVIADDAGAQGIGGVMGGEDTSCTDATTDVFVESALFDPISVARTGRKLGIVSDARYRFERGVDPEFVLPGVELATKMILNFCGGEPSELVVAGAPPAWKRTIDFDPQHVLRLGGIDVPKDEQIAILKRLGFTVEDAGAMLKVSPPSWRSDIAISADLVEEVVRIYGLNKVASAPMERMHAVAKPVLTPAQRRVRTVRRELASRGFNETITFSFISREQAKLFGGGDDARQVDNPIAADLDALRPSVLPSLLTAAQRNAARGFNDLMLFEIGAQFLSGMPEAQTTVAAGLRLGEGAKDWMKSGHLPDVFDAKADMLAVLETAMGAKMTAPIKAGAPAWYHPGRSGTLALGPKVLAAFGELHPKILAAFDLKGPIAAFEVFMDAIPEPKAAKSKARPTFAPSSFQAVERDFAFVVETTVTADEVLRAAKAVDRNLIETTAVFDVYEGKGVPAGKKSLAISVRIQPRDKTLTDQEIDALAAKIVAAVAKATGAVLRT
ncbi:MAG: phenylalanine--tRNA ligase subunit beta [Alphaproteobacteria bacterium]|nr:phenylalanine--tRNA ligase subunit beta [Alphaproteobacteria bacterium]MBL7099620.1 phenylalanine--tRNA ligase subunit beta [Alphaproteobacteria bacterium]